MDCGRRRIALSEPPRPVELVRRGVTSLGGLLEQAVEEQTSRPHTALVEIDAKTKNNTDKQYDQCHSSSNKT